ncbi:MULTISPECIES: hypothetical protein [Streptomyces]|nr:MULTISPECIES: hypothetical protein [Streptomyces]
MEHGDARARCEEPTAQCDEGGMMTRPVFIVQDAGAAEHRR